MSYCYLPHCEHQDGACERLEDENPADELFIGLTPAERQDTERQLFYLQFRRQAQESAKLIADAKELVWKDLPILLRRHYLDMARQK